jgi:long-chain fatty acid transport protein
MIWNTQEVMQKGLNRFSIASIEGGKMKATIRFFLLLAVVASMVFSAEVCSGSGFALFEGSARGNALGGALVGRADDPSALFYNPAGITQLPGLQVMAGATFVMPTTDVTTTNPQGVSTTTSTKANTWVPPHLYATYQATDRVWLGLGIFSPFGLGTEFPENWPGASNNYKAIIQTVNINPNIAFKINDKLSFALGVDLMWMDLDIKHALPVGNNIAGGVALQGSSLGMGLNVAVHGKPYDWLRLGLSYRSQVSQNVNGDALYTKTPYYYQAGLGIRGAFQNTNASGSVTLPDELFLGAAMYPTKDLSFEVGLIWTRWSTYNSLAIQFGVPPSGVGSSTVTYRKDWQDVVRPFLGVEYKTTDWLDLRAGFAYDQEAINKNYVDYLVPANDRFLFSFGPGFRWQNWTLDISYTYLYIVDRTDIKARGTPDYVLPSSFSNGHANMIGCSLGYKF